VYSQKTYHESRQNYFDIEESKDESPTQMIDTRVLPNNQIPAEYENDPDLWYAIQASLLDSTLR